MKVLAISYSYTGRCRKLRQALAARLGWAEGEITDRAPGRAPWRCVLDSLLRRKPAIRYAGPALDGFDAVVLIAPIWLGKLAAPMRSFVHCSGSRLPLVALVSVMGGNGAPEALNEVSRLLGRPPAVDASFSQREIDDGSLADHLDALGCAIERARVPATGSHTTVLAPETA